MSPCPDKGAEQRQYAELDHAVTDGQQAGLRVNVSWLLATLCIAVRRQNVLDLNLWRLDQQSLLLQLFLERCQASIGLHTPAQSLLVWRHAWLQVLFLMHVK